MARTMLSEMVRLLKTQGANQGKVTRYKAMWNTAKKGKKPLPCPMCYGQPPGNPGGLSLIDGTEGLKTAKCDKCGPLNCDEFTNP